MEIWKLIEEIPNMEISDMGRFRRTAYNYEKIRNGKKVVVKMKSKLRKLSKDNNGYLKLVVHTKHGVKAYVAHRLVAKYFLDDYDENLEVDHINDCRDDNRAENLRMVTRLENVRKPTTLAKVKKYMNSLSKEEKHRRAMKAIETMKQNGIKFGRNKKTVVKIGYNTVEFIDDISLLENFNRTAISLACNGKYGKKNPHRYKGFDWYFTEDYEKRLGNQS